MAELKPCPFCGGDAKQIAGSLFDGICIIKCVDCEAEITRLYDHPDVEDFAFDGEDVRNAAVRAWNRRAEDGK